MTKKEARTKYRKLRNSLTEDQIKLASVDICQQLNELDFGFKTVHVFLPITRLKELVLNDFISKCYSENKIVCTSVSDFETNTMKTVQITPKTLFNENEWGIPEPAEGNEISEQEIDLIIVPLLYADKQGNRIGYGKGFYDRFLAKCRPDALKIGVNYFQPDEVIEDAEETDIRIDELITT